MDCPALGGPPSGECLVTLHYPFFTPYWKMEPNEIKELRIVVSTVALDQLIKEINALVDKHATTLIKDDNSMDQAVEDLQLTWDVKSADDRFVFVFDSSHDEWVLEPVHVTFTLKAGVELIDCLHGLQALVLECLQDPEEFLAVHSAPHVHFPFCSGHEQWLDEPELTITWFDDNWREDMIRWYHDVKRETKEFFQKWINDSRNPQETQESEPQTCHE